MSVFGDGTYTQSLLNWIEMERVQRGKTSLQTLQAMLALASHYAENIEYEEAPKSEDEAI